MGNLAWLIRAHRSTVFTHTGRSTMALVKHEVDAHVLKLLPVLHCQIDTYITCSTEGTLGLQRPDLTVSISTTHCQRHGFPSLPSGFLHPVLAPRSAWHP